MGLAGRIAGLHDDITRLKAIWGKTPNGHIENLSDIAATLAKSVQVQPQQQQQAAPAPAAPALGTSFGLGGLGSAAAPAFGAAAAPATTSTFGGFNFTSNKRTK